MAREHRGARLYQRLLRLYPGDFREEYGDEMARLYRDRVKEEGALAVWIALVADLFRTAPMEQLSVLEQDVRHAFRLFSRTPIVTATALLTIALGVGGTTAVFSVVYAVMLRPLPYPQPDRLVELFEDNRQTNMAYFRVSALNYLSWADRSTSLEAIAAFQGNDLTLTDAGEPERLVGSTITASMFDVLGMRPILGRSLRTEDESPGGHRVALLGESLWRTRFGGDRDVIGQSVVLNGERHEIIGVVPRAFREVGRTQASSTRDLQVLVPLRIDPARENRGNHVMRVIGRLRPGVSPDRARDELRRIAATLEQEFPATNKGWSAQLRTVYDSMLDERVRLSLLVLFAAVGMVLLIACANVANVLLARSLSRQRELTLRTALGAGRSRLVRQLVTESVCLGVVSGACGLFFASIAAQALRAMLPATLPRMDEIRVDATVLGFGLLLSVGSGLVMGLMPAARASRVALMPSLVQHGKALAGSSRMLLRHGIVVAQMALATTLLVAAALLLQSFVRLQHIPLGFEPDGVITARISLPGVKYPDGLRTSDFYRRMLESLNGTSEVQSAALGTSVPFAPGVRAGGRARLGGDAGWINAVEHIVSPAYFETLRIPLLAGRSFSEQDGLGLPPVAVISESLARQLWAGKNAIGQTVEWNGTRQHEVIGVVKDVRGAGGQARGGGVEQEPAAALYLSSTQFPQRTMTVLVRTAGDAARIVPAIARAAQELDRAQPLYQVRSLRDWVDESTAQPRFTTTLSGAFALIALLLAAVGVYGVLSYSVAQRTQEIGVRMAIGADRTRILASVLRSGITLASIGIAAGLSSAFALSRVLATLLFNVEARDPVTYAVAGGLLALVAALACYIPAARATRIDPVIALRAE